jgi:hypothetical protein
LFLHSGRLLQPLLYIHLYPCQKGMNRDTLSTTNIEGRLHDFYKHDIDDMVNKSPDNLGFEVDLGYSDDYNLNKFE